MKVRHVVSERLKNTHTHTTHLKIHIRDEVFAIQSAVKCGDRIKSLSCFGVFDLISADRVCRVVSKKSSQLKNIKEII